MTIIGLGYKARHGKDSVANHLVTLLPGARIFSFADDLKALARALGMQEKNPLFLQRLGNAMRALNENYWVRALQLRLDEARPEFAIVPDVRFVNEVHFIKDNLGIVVKVERFESNGVLYVDPSRDANHESEVALDGYDGWDEYIVAKSGHMDVLAAGAQRIAKRVRG